MKKPKLYAEIASTIEDQTRGLMGRKHLPYNNGMLFDFGKEKKLSFWMSNTYIPLQIGFIKANGKIGQIERMSPLSTKTIYSNSEYRYALEINDGWFDDHKIKVGAQVQIPGTEEQSEESEGEEAKQTSVSPDIVIKQHHRQILEAVGSTYKMKINVNWKTISGKVMPLTTIEPPFVFGDTADTDEAKGETNGLLTASDCAHGGWVAMHIDLIERISSWSQDPQKSVIINNVSQLPALYAGIPNTPREEQSVKGKLGVL